MKPIQKLLLAGVAVTTLLLAGCAEGRGYGGPYYESPYHSYYGPYYSEGAVVLGRNFRGGYHYYGGGLARTGGFHRSFHGGRR